LEGTKQIIMSLAAAFSGKKKGSAGAGGCGDVSVAAGDCVSSCTKGNNTMIGSQTSSGSSNGDSSEGPLPTSFTFQFELESKNRKKRDKKRQKKKSGMPMDANCSIEGSGPASEDDMDDAVIQDTATSIISVDTLPPNELLNVSANTIEATLSALHASLEESDSGEDEPIASLKTKKKRKPKKKKKSASESGASSSNLSDKLGQYIPAPIVTFIHLIVCDSQADRERSTVILDEISCRQRSCFRTAR
jgi:hypothetical protein